MIKFGIDTSRWQGDFDFKGAKDNEGVDFVIIKAGGADDGLYEDREFENSYNKLESAGIHKGAYYFGNALSTDEAVNEEIVEEAVDQVAEDQEEAPEASSEETLTIEVQ